MYTTLAKYILTRRKRSHNYSGKKISISVKYDLRLHAINYNLFVYKTF